MLATKAQRRQGLVLTESEALKRYLNLVVAGEATFVVTGDVTEAHRQVPVHAENCHFLCWHPDEGAVVLTDTMGTFGVSSASYYWSWVAATIGRVTQYTYCKLCYDMEPPFGIRFLPRS